MKSEQFLFFHKKDENKIIAVKITSKLEDSQAFVYDVCIQKIEREYSGKIDDDRAFLSVFSVFPDDSGCVNTLLDNRAKESWRFMDYNLAKQYSDFVDLLNNQANDFEVSSSWKSDVEDYFSKFKH
ncbi:hypothetical protein EZS27_019749 [termite gut metagenome]|jgi:hypothetical protein|uniref:Uncharacterized protein n=1 Tax=termite gut metagenome TaxID=433724 RepID=A0A5J4REC1_9ZZZZ